MMLKDKTIIITGASSGIGKAIAIHLSSKGAKCVLIARDLERLQQTQALCNGETLILPQDLSEFQSYDALLESISEKFGLIDGFVHAAGIQQTIPLQQLKTEDLLQIFSINVFSAIEFTKRITKKKYKNKKQSIVFIASVMGVVGNKALTSYSASKGAIIAMVKSMALELSSKNIRVNAVSPSHIQDTKMFKNKEQILSDEANEAIRLMHPLGLGESLDVAEAVSFLLTDKAKWITGQNMILDGGYSIQ